MKRILAPLDRKELESLGCDCDECQESEIAFLHSHCHPDAPTWAVYNRRSGVLRIDCAQCGKFIADFWVKERGN
jgi:hypothetical protein